MTERKDTSRASLSKLDRPGAPVPSVDRPWDDTRDRETRDRIARRDLSRHRAYQSIFEDMLQ